MTEELKRSLTALAEKLGVTVEHLWDVLVRQALYAGIFELIWLTGRIGFMILLVIMSVKIYRHFEKEDALKRAAASKDTEESLRVYSRFADVVPFAVIQIFVPVFAGVLLIGTASWIPDAFYNMITDFLNPEYYALQHLPWN